MIRLKSLFFIFLILFFAASLSFSNASEGTQNVEGRYAKAVRQLRKDGFKGIDKALSTFKDLIRKSPDFLDAYISAADAYLLKYEFSTSKNPGWLKNGLAHLDTCTEKKRDFSVAYFKKAILYFNLNKPEQAVKNVKIALKINPKYLDARILYLQYLLSTHKKEEAKKFADVSAKYFPKDPAPLKFFGDIFSKAHAYKDAMRYYNGVLQLVAHAPYTHLALGKNYQNQNKLNLAIKHYTKAIELDPNLYEAHFNLSYCYSKTDKIKEAIKHLKIYSGKFPNDVSVLNNLALLYEQSGKIRKARLMWLKTKEKAKDKVYKKRAEAHLYNLIHKTQKGDLNTKQTSEPSQGGKSDEEKK